LLPSGRNESPNFMVSDSEIIDGNASMIILAEGRGLLEGPAFSPALGLLFADASNGGVWRLTDHGEAGVVVRHRTGIGGIALHANGGVIVTGRNVAFKPIQGDSVEDVPTTVLIDQSPEAGVFGFNDLTVDPHGRVYVGWFGYSPTRDRTPKSGGIFCIDFDGTWRPVATDLYVPNGLAFSDDGTRLYVADSLRRVIFVYEVDGAGNLSNRSEFAHTYRGLPDGIVVAKDGSVWVATAHEGAVIVFNAGGSEISRIRLPMPLVTSLTFGGVNAGDLYIVTGPGHDPDDRSTGTVFMTRPGVVGVAARLAQIDVTAKFTSIGSIAATPPRRAALPPDRNDWRSILCPRCNGPLKIDGAHDLGVLSRIAQELICGPCGTDETLGKVVDELSWPVSVHEVRTLELWG
jgi:D-xylonolactonase